MTQRRSDAPFVTVVLPCLDEASSIAACVEEAFEGLANSDLSGEVLVVDNGSTDGSADLARRAGARLISEPIKGVGSAIRTGFREARGDLVVMSDSDGTYDLSRLGDLVGPIVNDEADLMLGSRLNGSNRRTMPFLHRFVGTPVLSFLLRRSCKKLPIRDSQSGYRAMETDRARALELKATGFEMTSEMLIRSSQKGLRIREIPLEYRPRIGKSKLNTFVDGWRHLQLILLMAPQVLLFWPGVASLTAGLALSVLAIFNPGGFDLGSLRWQPIFFAPILIVLGTLAALSGAVITHYSPLGRSNRSTRFGFAGGTRLVTRSIAIGGATLSIGLVIDLILFIVWITREPSPTYALALAGLAQAFVITGAVLVAFGLIYRVIARQTGYLEAAGDVDIADFVVDSDSLSTSRHSD